MSKASDRDCWTRPPISPAVWTIVSTPCALTAAIRAGRSRTSPRTSVALPAPSLKSMKSARGSGSKKTIFSPRATASRAKDVPTRPAPVTRIDMKPPPALIRLPSCPVRRTRVNLRPGIVQGGRSHYRLPFKKKRGPGQMARISRLEKELSAQRTGLIMFDSLNGYLHPRDPAKVKFLEERNILPNMQKLVQGARRVGMNAFYPSGAHAADGSDTVARLTDTDMDLGSTEGASAVIKPRFYAGSKDSEIAPEIAPARRRCRHPQTSLEFLFPDRSRPAIARARHRDDHHLRRLDRCRHRLARSLRRAISTMASSWSATPAIRRAATTTSSSWSASSRAWAA